MIGHRAEKQHLRFGLAELALKERRRFHQRRFVSDIGRAIGQRHGLMHAVHAGSGDQKLLGRCPLRHPFPELDLFVRAQHHAFARGRYHHIAAETGGVPLLDIVLDFDFPQLAFVIEGSGDGAEDALELHKRSRFMNEKRGRLRWQPPRRFYAKINPWRRR